MRIPRSKPVFVATLGAGNIADWHSEMGSEDFGLFGLPGRKIPVLFLRVGATGPAKLSENQRTGVSVHGLHSAFFAPVPSPTIRTGVIALTAAVIELLKR